MIINDIDYSKTGGLTEQELKVYDLLDYRLLKLPEYKKQEIEIRNLPSIQPRRCKSSN